MTVWRQFNINSVPALLLDYLTTSLFPTRYQEGPAAVCYSRDVPRALAGQNSVVISTCKPCRGRVVDQCS